MDKLRKLEEIIKSYKKIMVAFSGGLDSSFLLYFAKKTLGKENTKAITIYSPYKISQTSLEQARNIIKFLDIPHMIINTSLPEEIKYNPIDKCYFCKKEIFSKIKELANKEGFILCDGTNYDDLNDYRPGIKALKELEIISPLLEAELTKKEIRNYARKYKLPFWDKMPDACLISRLPNNKEIKLTTIQMVENAEDYLKKLGFKVVRVRVHDNLARIEVGEKELKKILKPKITKQIDSELKKIGFKYVSIDCKGYKMGSMNG
ncbi:MAG: ATP-dependent sacrificial sulfur transferase LarE [Brevinematales bacterium]|nr:ATP-dependent sacrificial sulfur transferase LarE [Brevinematales bacterium]